MPVMPGYTFADTPHQATVAPIGYRYGCSSTRTGDTSPRGGTTKHIAHPWSANAGQLVVTNWLPIPCGHTTRATDAACEGCCNRGDA